MPIATFASLIGPVLDDNRWDTLLSADQALRYSRAVPLRPVTVRFDDRVLTAIRDASESLGVSSAQFIRDAALIRAVMVTSEHPVPINPTAWRELSDELKRLSE